MPPRSNWKGYLRLSLVSCPVALFPATSESERVSFHMLNPATGDRLKQQYVDAQTGEEVERSKAVKGYEIAKGDYVMVSEEELDRVEIESSHIIDIQSFADAANIDPVYYDSRYYLAPEDEVGAEAFAVIREAMRKRNVVGLARVAMYGRERAVAIEPRGPGMLATTLHYAYEIRDDKACFGEVPKVEVDKDMLDLALHIIDGKTAAFDPSAFKDRYQDALVALIRAKRAGKPLPAPRAEEPGNVVNLMDALRRSVGEDAGKGPMKTGGEAKRKGAEKASPKRKSAAAGPRTRKTG